MVLSSQKKKKKNVYHATRVSNIKTKMGSKANTTTKKIYGQKCVLLRDIHSSIVFYH